MGHVGLTVVAFYGPKPDASGRAHRLRATGVRRGARRRVPAASRRRRPRHGHRARGRSRLRGRRRRVPRRRAAAGAARPPVRRLLGGGDLPEPRPSPARAERTPRRGAGGRDRLAGGARAADRAAGRAAPRLRPLRCDPQVPPGDDRARSRRLPGRRRRREQRPSGGRRRGGAGDGARSAHVGPADRLRRLSWWSTWTRRCRGRRRPGGPFPNASGATAAARTGGARCSRSGSRR